MCTISLTLAKPGEAMPRLYSSLMVFSPACFPERCRTAGPWEETQINADAALVRLFTSNKDSRTRRRAQCGACDCQERIRQLVVFTPGSRSD